MLLASNLTNQRKNVTKSEKITSIMLEWQCKSSRLFPGPKPQAPDRHDLEGHKAMNLRTRKKLVISSYS